MSERFRPAFARSGFALAGLKLSQPARLRPGFDLHHGKKDAYSNKKILEFFF
jgi:hypothetical protein